VGIKLLSKKRKKYRKGERKIIAINIQFKKKRENKQIMLSFFFLPLKIKDKHIYILE
jgi:hypothetical protein